MRKEIIEFAEEMEKVMCRHDAEKGDSWKTTCDMHYLERGLVRAHEKWMYEDRKKIIKLRDSGKPIVSMCGACIETSYFLFNQGITYFNEITDIIRANVSIPRQPPFLILMYGKNLGISKEVVQ